METSFSDSKDLGRFVGEPSDQKCKHGFPRGVGCGYCTAVASAGEIVTEQIRQELEAAYQRITMLEADLLECREYLEDHVEVNDGDDGPVPNRAMALVSMIDESLHGPGNF